ncbi:hypothetical protein BGX31_000559 [Mortierella sp. GBA43]|nr:hypothetical protein BGX31_000559 [Mortierella sp. GBA43]
MSAIGEQSSQAFRGSSRAGIIYISTVLDNKTGKRIVLWEDIQDVFRDAQYVRNGNAHVSFMRDENFTRIMPLRIAYYPEAVLDVVEGPATPTSPSGVATGLSNDRAAMLLERDVVELSISSANIHAHVHTNTNTNVGVQSLVKFTRGMPQESQTSLRTYSQLYNNYFEAIMAGQQVQADNIKQSMDVHFVRLQIEMDKNKALQEEMVSMQQRMQQLQQQARDEIIERQREMDKKQDRMIKMQEQTLNRLATIQNKIQALLTQTYELHEYPIPRLFIVLPKVVGLGDRLTNPFANQFRLYFLCECGPHTMPENCKTPHEIHLAKHEGYDLEQPTKFFEKYGKYLLVMMHMVKYGIAVAGMVVPALAGLHIPGGPSQGQQDMNHLKKNMGPLVEDTIKYLQEIQQNMETNTELMKEETEFDKIEALEGADLRQLESYLKIKDQGRVLGSLYRIVTQEGHVKWVCFDHYKANYQESAMEQLLNVVAVNNGQFIRELGKIKFETDSNVLAKQLYDALIKTRGIQELEITLGWGPTMDELQALASAVTRAGVVRLAVNGTQVKGPALDFVNRNRRFDPIAQLAFNGRVQSLQLKGFEDFFSRVTSPSLALTSKFREFSMDSPITSKDKAIKSFNGFLDHCQSLTRVDLKFQKQSSISKSVKDIVGKLRKLESLKVDRENMSFTASVSDNRIQDMSLTIERLGDLGVEDLTFMLQNDLTQLSIEYTPQRADETRLRDLILRSRRLNTLQIGCIEARCLAVINLVVHTRTELQQRGSCPLQTFELMGEKLGRFDKYANFSDATTIHSRLSFHKGSSAFDMRTWIRLRWGNLVTEEEPVCHIVREYGWSIVHVRAPVSCSDTFMGVLNDVIRERGSQLEMLEIFPFTLTYPGLNCLDCILERSPEPVGLALFLSNMEYVGHVKKAQDLLEEAARAIVTWGNARNVAAADGSVVSDQKLLSCVDIIWDVL